MANVEDVAGYKAAMAAIDDCSHRLTSIDGTLASLDARLRGVETELINFQQETNAHFDSIDLQLGEIKALITSRPA